MIVYADTSALVKLIIREAGSADMLQLRPQITVLATARIAYVELRAALAAMRRNKRLAPVQYRQAKRQLEGLWRSTSPIEIDTNLVIRAFQPPGRGALDAFFSAPLLGARKPGPDPLPKFERRFERGGVVEPYARGNVLQQPRGRAPG